MESERLRMYVGGDTPKLSKEQIAFDYMTAWWKMVVWSAGLNVSVIYTLESSSTSRLNTATQRLYR